MFDLFTFVSTQSVISSVDSSTALAELVQPDCFGSVSKCIQKGQCAHVQL